MALAALSGDEQRIIFVQLCNPLDPGVAVAFSSTNSELWTLTQAPRQQLQADHEAAAALGRKAGKRSCKELREAKKVVWHRTGVSIACRGRKQTRGLKEMTASGPLAKLEEALELAQSYPHGETELPPLRGSEA